MTTIKVFRVNDYEWWAGENLEAIKPAYKEMTGIDPDNEDEGFQDPHELTEAEMERFQHLGDCGQEPPISFRAMLDKMIAEGVKFPSPFATTEY